MSSYPYPYDVRLLEDAPKATEAGKLGGHSINPLAGGNSDEYEISEYRRPMYRQKKWRIFMLIGAILVIGVIVGSVVGGTLTSKSTKSNSPSNGIGPSTTTFPTWTSSPVPDVPAGSSLPPAGSSSGANVVLPTSGG